MQTAAAPRSRFVAITEGSAVRALIEGERLPLLAPEGGYRDGVIVIAQRESGRARVLTVLAEPGTALAELHQLAAASGIDLAYPDAVMAEVERWLGAPGTDDSALADRTALPFVTIDGAHSRDLDQALFVEQVEAGFVVHYAIADCAYYVPRTSALFAESLRRGASYYLPGLSLPMLPRPLSEGLVSLNPGVVRRALVFEMRLDARGHCTETRLVPARIRSRAKLAFEEVQSLYDEPAKSPLAGSEFEASLWSLAAVGRARLRESEERDVVRYQRRELDVSLGGAHGESFVVLESPRRDVELFNEQLSLLCNAEGARLLRESAAPYVAPIYRVHPPPEPGRVEALRESIRALAALHGLPDAPWVWDAATQSLAEYVARLPVEGEHARIGRAIQRLAVMVNVRSTYATEPAAHFGTGFEPYARFSAPMREVVGVYLHGEAAELLAGRADALGEDVRGAVVDAANRSKDTQRRMNDLVNRRVIDRLFAPEVERERARRTRWTGTIMGVSSNKLYVQLDAPGIDVKVYVRDLGKSWKAFLVPDALGLTLTERDSGRVRARVGDAITIRVVSRDAQWDRYVLEPVDAI